MSTFDKQRPALIWLAEMATQYPPLPAPIVTVGGLGGADIDLQLRSFADFEAWRKALGIGEVQERFVDGGIRRHLYADTERAGVPVHLIADGPVIPVAAKEVAS